LRPIEVKLSVYNLGELLSHHFNLLQNIYVIWQRRAANFKPPYCPWKSRRICVADLSSFGYNVATWQSQMRGRSSHTDDDGDECHSLLYTV